MRRLVWIALLALPACGNIYHPEYHPVTSVRYTQTVGYPVSVHAAPGGQPITIAPPPVPPFAPPPPIGIPSPAPPEMDPPEMGW